MRLRELRERAGLTQTALAKRARLSIVYVSLLESGKRKNPSMDVILRLAESLGVTVEQLLIGRKAG